MYHPGSEPIQPTPQHLRLIWAVLSGTLIVLAFVVEGWLTAEPGFAGLTGDGMPIDLLRYALAAAGLMTGIGILVVRKWSAPDERGVSTRQADPEAARKQARRVFTVRLVSMAMADSIAMYGLVLFLLGGQRIDFYMFAVPALLLMFLLRPADGARQI